MIEKLWRLRRSLFLQLSLISLGAAIILIGQAIIKPYWEYSKIADPLRYTEGVIQQLMNGVVTGNIKGPEGLIENGYFKDVAAANPNFSIYYRTEETEFQYGSPPAMLKVPDATSRPTSPAQLASNPNIPKCYASARGMLPFERNGIHGSAHYDQCPGASYYMEISGIENPVFTPLSPLQDFWGNIRFSQAENYILVAVAVLLIALAIVLKAVRALYKVGGVASRIELGSGEATISEKGLPLEVRPLVRSINSMLTRLEDAHEKQSFFLAAAAHELRTPLTILRTRLEVLEDDKHKHNMREDIKRMSSLVEQLLNLTQLHALEKIDLRPTNLVDVTSEVMSSRVSHAIDQGISLEFVPSSEEIVVKGEEGIMALAIANLIDNAVSFSAAGDTVLVEVGEDGSVVVRDQGPGVAPDQIAGIMEPFTKFPPNRSGYGLGLAIVKTIMEKHGGDVSVTNAGDRGAIFTLNFAGTTAA